MSKEFFYRQGDVFLFLRPDGKKALKKAKKRDKVLILGESTGHSHVITKGEVYVDESGKILVDASSGGKIEHLVGGRTADHPEIEMDPGVYEYVHQREHFPEGWQRVVD